MTWSDPIQTEQDELPEGTQLDGRYGIRSMLGEGGLGNVYLAEDLARGHDVALKIPIPRYRGRPEREQRLLNEAKLARQIGAHPNLPRFFDRGRLRDLGDCAYVTWEVVKGRDLNSLLMLRYTIKPRVAVGWARQLADVLCAMHQAGVVHRDVTVTNVFIEDPDGDPRVKLIDLSHSARLPRPGEPTHRITRELEVPGAHRYMAPEQAMAAPPHPKMDVFSFGVVLYEMLTGRNPFGQVQHREAYIELQCAGQLQVARIDRRVYPDVPEALAELVVACTHHDVDQRLGMAEVRARLDELSPRVSVPVLVAIGEPEDPQPLDEVATAPIDVPTEPVERPDRPPIAAGPPAEADHARVEPAGLATAPTGARAEPAAVEDGSARSLRTLVLIAAAMVVVTAVVMLLVWPGNDDGDRDPGAPTRPPVKEQPPRVLPRSEPTSEAGPPGDPEPTSAPVAEPKPEVSPGPRPTTEPEPGPTIEPKPEVKPGRRVKIPPHKTEACQRTVADARSAAQSLTWRRLETLTRKKRCFRDRREWAEMRVLALSNTGRFEECVGLADTIKNPTVQRYASICRAQKGKQ